MSSKQVEAISVGLHPQAADLARKYTNDFAISLVIQAKLIAYQTRADLVLRQHVEEALRAVTLRRAYAWSREIGIVVGGALFGAFIQGFVSEVASGNVILIVTYTILGFVGMFFVFNGLRR